MRHLSATSRVTLDRLHNFSEWQGLGLCRVRVLHGTHQSVDQVLATTQDVVCIALRFSSCIYLFINMGGVSDAWECAPSELGHSN